mmetsp:Transcript_2023/g.5873  ORF Transcript_2023/g.5873 Transcript_2023/m.5873 type:complete len:218 (-) Transcript_2023:1608-2261(-)
MTVLADGGRSPQPCLREKLAHALDRRLLHLCTAGGIAALDAVLLGTHGHGHYGQGTVERHLGVVQVEATATAPRVGEHRALGDGRGSQQRGAGLREHGARPSLAAGGARGLLGGRELRLHHRLGRKRRGAAQQAHRAVDGKQERACAGLGRHRDRHRVARHDGVRREGGSHLVTLDARGGNLEGDLVRDDLAVGARIYGKQRRRRRHGVGHGEADVG